MKNTPRFFLVLFTLLTMVISGCDLSSSHSKTSSQRETAHIQTGVFIDNEVAGIRYKTETQSGITGSGGEYQYIQGETITFSLGTVSLPAVLAQRTLTPLGLVGTSDTNNVAVVNIVRLLLSLDEDGDSSNGIQIGEDTHEFANGITVDFNSETFDTDVTELVANSGSSSQLLIDATTAKTHLEKTIASIETAPDIFTPHWLSTKTLYSVRYDATEDVLNSETGKVAIVKQLKFNAGATQVAEIGLLNSNSNEVVSVAVNASGLLYQINNKNQGRAVVCESNEQYVKTHVITNGQFDSVDLLFFDEIQALDFANALTESISPCGFELNIGEGNEFNTPPVATADEATANEDAAINIFVLDNDSDWDENTLTIDSATANNGNVSIINGRTLTYTAKVNFNGADTITYNISDGQGGTASSTVAVTIIPVNDSPVAAADNISTNEDTSVNINVLANDSDADGDSLIVSAASAGKGAVSIESDNSLNYTPNNNFNGIDTISYTVNDTGNPVASASGTVTVSITASNDDPVAVKDSASLDEDTSVIITVLSNDSDAEDDTLTVDSASSTNGTAGVNISDNTITFIPNADFNGLETLGYVISDGNGGTANGTIDVTVNAINDNPVAVADIASGGEDTRITFNVLNNDTDVDGDTLTVTNATASSGNVSIRTDQQLELLPSVDFNGSVTINYTISDGSGGTDSTTATVTVTAVNDAPNAVADTALTSENTLLNITALDNDTDSDGDTLTITAATAGNGNVTIISATTIDYAPSFGFTGSDTISYEISDGNGGTASSTIIITVIGELNNPPQANADTAITNEDIPVNIDVLVNDTDADSDLLSITTASATNGAVTVNGGIQTLNFVPDSNFNGIAIIDYTISDGNGDIDSSTVTVTVAEVNDAPTINEQAASVAESATNTTSVMTITGSDIDGDTLSYSITAGNTDSIFGINTSSGEITVTSNTFLNFESKSQYFLTVQVTDSGSGNLTASATVTVDITDVEESVSPTIDSGFGTNGTASSDPFASKTGNSPKSALLQSGKMIVVGGNKASNGLMTMTRFNSDGTVDRTFGNNGVTNLDVFNDNGASDEAVAVALASDGKIVVAGTHNIGDIPYTFTARFSTDGDLDTSFNYVGYHVASEAGPITAYDMKIHSSGAILVAGSDGDDFKIINFTSNGQSYVYLGADISEATATAIVLQSDGKAVLTGSSVNVASLSDFTAVRFDISPTFQIDTSYGNSGIISYDLGGSLGDISYDSLINSSDEIVLVGSTVAPSLVTTDVAAIKIDSTGALISSFGANGRLILDIDGDGGSGIGTSSAQTIETDSSNNLYFGVNSSIFMPDAVVLKTDNNGFVLTAFGNVGSVSFDLNSTPNTTDALVIDSSDQPMLATTTDEFGFADLVVARFTSSGELDMTFSDDGFNKLDPTFTNNVLNEMIELTVSPHSGKFVAVGTANSDVLVVARYNSDGSLDQTFGDNGHYRLMGSTSTYTGQDIAELSNGKLVVVGKEDSKGLIVLLKTEGTVDSTFGTQGIKTHSGGTALIFNAVAVDSNNKIIVAGSNEDTDSKNAFIMRMDLNGNADMSFGNDGVASFDLGLGLDDEVMDIAILSDNSIVGVGTKAPNALVFKLLNDGTLASGTFAVPNGFQAIDLNPVAVNNFDSLRRLRVKRDDKIVAAGYSVEAEPANVVIQFNSDGSLDASFDTDGIVSHNYGGAGAKILGLDLDALDRILITGLNSNGSNDDIFVARITSNGTKDTQFNGSSGGILFDYGEAEMATAIKVQADGTVVIAGADNLNLFPTDFFFIQKLKLVQP